MPQILADHEIAERINSLNSKKKKVFNVAYTWAKDYLKYNKHNV